MDYCFSQREVSENPDAHDSLFDICNGNMDAYRFIWRCWNFFHLMDDLVDRDKPVSINDAAKELFLFTQEISLNPFYNLHKHQILPFVLNACNGWVCGEEMADGNDEERKLSPAIKCSDFNLYSFVAFLTGGWDNMRKADARFRIYDKE